MALLKSKIAGFGCSAARVCVRSLSSFSTKESNVKKSVYISQSNDVFVNLAIEEWMANNLDFTDHHVLLLTRNEPSVVIGKNQNPWLESNVPSLEYIGENGVALARRQSGGTTIYNDKGNLNMVFFTRSDKYNSKYNLELISRALFRKYNTKLDISSIDHLKVNNKNVSFLY